MSVLMSRSHVRAIEGQTGLKLFLSLWLKGYIAHVYRLDPCTAFFAKIFRLLYNRVKAKLIFVRRRSKSRKDKKKRKPKEVENDGTRRPKHHQEHGTQNLEPESLQI